jgi:serine/threonine protein kinase
VALGPPDAEPSAGLFNTLTRAPPPPAPAAGDGAALASQRHLADLLMDFDALRLVRTLGRCTTLREDPETGELIVVRSLSRRAGEASDPNVVEQVSFLLDCPHPCFLRLVGWSFPSDAPDNRLGVIGTEYAPLGSLETLMRERQSGRSVVFLEGTGLAILVCGLVRGLRYLHGRELIHTALAPSLIFVTKSGRVRIGGVESTRDLSLDVTLTRGFGSPLYQAPELNEADDPEFPPAVDVYSFGLILYEMLFGEPVFPPDAGLKRIAELAAGSERPVLPRGVCIGVRRILQRSWSADPLVRDSFEEIERQLDAMDFQITPGVDAAQVRAYLAELDDFEVQKRASKPTTKSS